MEFLKHYNRTWLLLLFVPTSIWSLFFFDEIEHEKFQAMWEIEKMDIR